MSSWFSILFFSAFLDLQSIRDDMTTTSKQLIFVNALTDWYLQYFTEKPSWKCKFWQKNDILWKSPSFYWKYQSQTTDFDNPNYQLFERIPVVYGTSNNWGLRHLKRGIQDFHMNYVLVPADKAANNVVVVWRLYYINTLKRELVDTNAYKRQPSLSERVIVDGHGCHTALHFGVKAKENQDKVPTLYWLPKLHKKPYKARFIANSSSCTTTELSKLLTSCLTAVKKTCYQILWKSIWEIR